MTFCAENGNALRMGDEQVFEYWDGETASGLVCVVDHASNRVPEDIDLGIDPELRDFHIAIDIGAHDLARAVCERLGCPAVVAHLSRLVVDLHREADNPAAIPVESDGHVIPGNAALDARGRQQRIDRFWRPYHARVEREIEQREPKMLFTIHSFTPQLRSKPDQERPWECGILYNEDERAPRIAIPLLEAEGLTVGDNEPYSGKLLNATMNHHAEARGLPYLAIEVRNDLIGDAAGVSKWADILAPVIAETRDTLP